MSVIVNNNNVSNAFKVADEIINRLFNHKPFISGEVHYMVKQFEQTRNEQEIEQLLQTFERTTDFKDTRFDLANHLSSSYADIDSSLDSIGCMMDEILSLQSNSSSFMSIDDVRERRSNELDQLVKFVKSQIDLIDNDYQLKVNDLKLYYCDLETKLRIPSDLSSV